MNLPPLHPMVWDPIESQRCPQCGKLAELIGVGPWPFEEWGCRDCDAEVLT